MIRRLALRCALPALLAGCGEDDLSACPDVAVARLPRDPHGHEDPTFRSCTDRFDDAEACLAGCDDLCQQELASRWDEPYSYSESQGLWWGRFGVLGCGPVWFRGQCCVVADWRETDPG